MLGNPSTGKKKSNLSTPSQKLTKRQNNPTDGKKNFQLGVNKNTSKTPNLKDNNIEDTTTEII